MPWEPVLAPAAVSPCSRHALLAELLTRGSWEQHGLMVTYQKCFSFLLPGPLQRLLALNQKPGAWAPIGTVLWGQAAFLLRGSSCLCSLRVSFLDFCSQGQNTRVTWAVISGLIHLSWLSLKKLLLKLNADFNRFGYYKVEKLYRNRRSEK